ncbi:hypothetical protein [Dongia sp.]|uniref:hypothetical protein n=1 Tax=Dongia sp. TaxID=1977262 RepID=UPI003753777E
MADITGTPAYINNPVGVESRFSGVSWGAIIAGGVAAAALTVLLWTLGAGLGLIAVSPWSNEGASAETVGIGVIVWSIIIEAAAFGVGGYLAGRLRTKWANMHGDEVYFRDTAHGLVTWALGTLVFICLVASVAGQVARGTAEVGGAVGGAAIAGAGTAAAATAPGMMAAGPRGGGMEAMRGNPMDYYVDLLFRPAGAQGAASQGAVTGTDTTTSATGSTTDTTTGGTTTTPGTTTMPAPMPMPMGDQAADQRQARGEILRIAATSFRDGTLTLAPEDKTYMAQLIAQRTGMSQQDAEKRIDEVTAKVKAAADEAATKAKEAADAARKAGAALAMWTVVAMLIGAFVSSYAATIGGRHRDL